MGKRDGDTVYTFLHSLTVRLSVGFKSSAWDNQKAWFLGCNPLFTYLVNPTMGGLVSCNGFYGCVEKDWCDSIAPGFVRWSRMVSRGLLMSLLYSVLYVLV